jgi:cupin fold WbuC family metalloprotein
MQKFQSKINNKLLHLIYRLEDIENRNTQREDLVDINEFIQCSSLKLNKGVTFKPHKHIWKESEGKIIAQESWIVLRGSVKCYFYDIDDKLIDTVILNTGDVSFTFEGGHNYEILEDNTIVYEYKTGPYKGQKLDKVFINA